MKNYANIFRLSVEIMISIAVGGAGVMFLLVVIAPGVVEGTRAFLAASLFFVLAAGTVWVLATGRMRALRQLQTMTTDFREAQKHSERLADIARKTTNAVIITDPKGKIEWVNEGFTRITGYAIDEVVGRTPGSVLQGPKSDPEPRAKLREGLRLGQSTEVEITNYSKDGRPYLIQIEMLPLRDKLGALTGFMAIETDITEKREAQAKIEAATEAKASFLANMSHEIRTPLNGIIGFADLLAKRADGGDELQRDEWVGIIHGSGTHLLGLLNDVLDFSKLDAGKMTIDPLPCRVVSVVSQCMAMLQQRAVEKGISLQTTVKEDCPPVARTDATRLRQIVTNLVGNAVKFTDVGGVLVTLSGAGTAERPRIRIDIKDTGVGMTQQQIGLLFQPFVQADCSTTRKYGGTGLGLTISKSLAERLGGGITVRSEPGLGSVFTVEIDAPPPLPGERAPEESVYSSGSTLKPGIGSRLHGRRILVVDDNPTNLKLFQLTLTKAGAEVVLVENGKLAVEAAAAQKFDAIAMDMQMPVMDGFAATRALRKLGSTLPILALTAYSSGADREKCLNAGCSEFLGKPVDLVVLVQTLERLIGGQAVVGAPSVARPLPLNPKTVIPSATECQIDDPDIRPLAEYWLSQLPERIVEMRSALERGDSAEVARFAHMIRGTSGSIGLPAFVDPAHTLEEAALVGDLVQAGMVLDVIASLIRRPDLLRIAA